MVAVKTMAAIARVAMFRSDLSHYDERGTVATLLATEIAAGVLARTAEAALLVTTRRTMDDRAAALEDLLQFFYRPPPCRTSVDDNGVVECSSTWRFIQTATFLPHLKTVDHCRE